MRGHDTGLDFHRVLLGDPVRMDAYDRAIRELIRPGDVVLDVGTGTGILALLAARQGARVHAVESMPIAKLARRLAAHNGLDEHVTVYEADIRELDPVEPVDWVIGEWMGRFVVDDEMFGAIEAAGRWLKPGGRFCPSRVTLKLGVVGDFDLPMVERFRDPLLGLSLVPAAVVAEHTCYAVSIGSETRLGPACNYATLEPPAMARAFDDTVALPVERDGELVGVAGWFEAELSPGVTLSTAPGVQTHWGQYLFPLERRPVRAGDVVWMHLRLDGDDWRWESSHGNGSSAQWTDPATGLHGDMNDVRSEALWKPAARESMLAGRDGAIAYQQGHMEDAVRLTRLATELCGPDDDPDYLRALYENLGLALLQTGRYAAAEQALLRAIDGRSEVSEDLLANLETARRYGG